MFASKQGVQTGHPCQLITTPLKSGQHRHREAHPLAFRFDCELLRRSGGMVKVKDAHAGDAYQHPAKRHRTEHTYYYQGSLGSSYSSIFQWGGT